MFTTIHQAVKANNIYQVRYLIGIGHNVNEKNFYNVSPLHLAVTESCNLQLVDLLLEHKADFNAKDQNNSTPLHWACEKRTNVPMVKHLLEYGAEVNARDNKKKTPLHIAVQEQNSKIVEFLLYYGADVNAKDMKGLTPIHRASFKEESIEMLNILLIYGADVNATFENNSTPLHWASKIKNNAKILKLMLKNGAKINARDFDKSTPLQLACYPEGNIENVKILLKYGADINAKDNSGSTALHIVIEEESNRAEVLKFLIENNADINARMNNQITPLYKSVFWGQKACVSELLNCGAEAYCNDRLMSVLNDEMRFTVAALESLLIVLKHLIKLKVINLLKDEIYAIWQSKLCDMESFEELCQAEINKMRNEKIFENRNLTFLDILTENLRIVASDFHLDCVREHLNGINYDLKFPLYSGMLKFKIKEGMGLKKLLNEGCNSLKVVLGDHRLPNNVLYEVLSYLGERDVRILNAIHRYLKSF